MQTPVNPEFDLHNPTGGNLSANAEMRQKKPLSDLERQHLGKRSLERFTRNGSAPMAMETLRYNLIAARVLNGMTAEEAAERFGYANGTQISMIELGRRPVPSKLGFLIQASNVYSVSIDFLMGLSPHTDLDGKIGREHALLRKTESLIGSVAESIASALIRFSEQEKIDRNEIERISKASLRLQSSMEALRNKGFDDFPSGAPLLAAVHEVVAAAEPAARKATQYESIDAFLANALSGKVPPLPHLTERYQLASVREEIFGTTTGERK